MKKIPWGIFAGISAMFVFFLTTGFILIYVVFGGIAKQTNSDFSMFQNWWQVLIFVFDLLFVFCMITSIVFYIRRKRNPKKELCANEKDI